MGGSGSSDQASSTQQISQTQLPPWINQSAQQNYAFAQDVANRPLVQYQGQQVADVGPQMQQAWNLAASSGGAGADQYNAAQAAYLTAAGTGPQQVSPNTLAGTNLQPYMSPYTSSVINATLPIMQTALGAQQSQIGDQAAAANAYGGSRQGVQQGVAQAAGAMNMAQMAAQLNQQNYGQAVGQATTDISNNLQAQQANQQANQANINSLIQAGTGLGGLGSAAQQNQRQQFLELSTAGAQQQQQAQNEIQAQMGQFNQAVTYPQQQLGILQSALGMTPYGSTTMGSSATQSQQTQQPSMMSDVFGGLQALGGMFGAGGPFGAGGALSALAPGSDRNLKTDITKVGMHPSGVPLYSYRYRGDPKSYPKVTGPMAEDVMKVAPHAVTNVGIHKPSGQMLHGVNMGALNAMPPVNDNLGGMSRLSGTANLGPSMRVPGAMSPPIPQGLTGAMGANMRAPRMRPRNTMPRVAGGMLG
jgi:hypothetical protein